MYKINQDDMKLIVNGASFLASGGGGGVSSANDVINNIMTFSQTVDVATVDEITASSECLVVCGVGAPDAPDLKFLNSPADGLLDLQKKTGKTYTHVLPIEVGAMNSMIPLLACAKLNIPFVDADGAGRSVPQMDMSTYGLKKFDPAPTLVVSEENKQFPLSPKTAAELESQVREVVSTELHDAGTVATWSLTGQQATEPEAVVPGSLSLAKELGVAMAGSEPLNGVLSLLDGYYEKTKVVMKEATVTHCSNKVEDGFDVGTITLKDSANEQRTIKLFFVNETLLSVVEENGIPVELMLGPDMLCSMGVNGQPMTNSEICNDFLAGKTVNVSLVWVQALKTIRKPEMFELYIQLIMNKFPEMAEVLKTESFSVDAFLEKES